MALIHFIILLSACQIFHVEAGIYTPHENLPDGVITKYLKGKTEVSCLLQCERDGKCDEAMFKLNDKQRRSGECWFVMKKISNDTKNEIKDMRQDKSIKSFKKLPICDKTPCYFGTCVKTDDSKEYKCKCKDKWTLIQRNVCFGARLNEFGKFKIPHNAVMNGIKLQHVGVSSLKCADDAIPSKWSCDKSVAS
ncbi:uncharacterized protein LOC130657461 [Hydractinia symbiolongicarpus]|uniref:uncharacterized protein LOC130657461 n=1 Tax=Hydractinia symbiolongicarpus TaxID=13093 RepID=UPI00254DE240|nr:uncharacterized protein LOC130657461 [Hydractinia symbiolongicarpus]